MRPNRFFLHPFQIVGLFVFAATLSSIPAHGAEEGCTELFNGKDLGGWTGDKKGYQAQGGMLVCKPGGNNIRVKSLAE